MLVKWFECACKSALVIVIRDSALRYCFVQLSFIFFLPLRTIAGVILLLSYSKLRLFITRRIKEKAFSIFRNWIFQQRKVKCLSFFFHLIFAFWNSFFLSLLYASYLLVFNRLWLFSIVKAVRSYVQFVLKVCVIIRDSNKIQIRWWPDGHGKKNAKLK